MADSQNTPQVPSVEDVSNALHTIFLAGVGAIAASTEKGSELFKSLVDKGQATVDEGKAKNAELIQNVQARVEDTKNDAIRAYLKTLTPEQRASFVESVQRAASEAEAEADKAAEAASDAADDVAAEAVSLDLDADDEVDGDA